MDVIFKLMNNKFSKLGYEEQLAVKEQGRPTPELKIEISGTSRGKSYRRRFHKGLYLRNSWICGCNQKNAFFCFPCLLFSDDLGEKHWTEQGVNDLVHLTDKIKKHENSKTHINNSMQFVLFGKGNVQAHLDSAYWINIQKRNDEVTKNRYVLSKIIDSIKFCEALNDELVNVSSELDKTLNVHLKNATIFKGNTSKSIQNELLQCMLDVYHEEILREINETPFLAVMADEMTDVTGKSQMVTVFRYVTKDGDPVERFWDVLLPANRDADAVFETILCVINSVLQSDSSKLIAQSYDSGAVITGEVQARIQKIYKNAHFVHCYAHQLNLVISKACSINSQVRIFFGDLHDIPVFFNHSAQRVAVLNEILGRNMRRSVPARWNVNIHTVNVVYEYRESIIECVEHLEEDSNTVTCKQASGIRRILQDPNFIFWLTFFHYVMPHVDVLEDELQKKHMEPMEARRVTNVFEENINNVRNKIDCIINVASSCDTGPSEVKRKRLNSNHHVACIDICDVIINNTKNRLAFTNHLVAASLLFSEHFVEYHNKFPDDALDLTCSAYNVLNKQRLRTELSVIYSNHECRELCGAVPFLKFIIANHLEDTMGETKKLLQILVTTPMIISETERNLSTLHRIKTFLRNAMREDRLTALLMLAMEKKFIATIANYNVKVIDKFAENKERFKFKLSQ